MSSTEGYGKGGNFCVSYTIGWSRYSGVLYKTNQFECDCLLILSVPPDVFLDSRPTILDTGLTISRLKFLFIKIRFIDFLSYTALNDMLWMLNAKDVQKVVF
jgi:hypothetical protein